MAEIRTLSMESTDAMIASSFLQKAIDILRSESDLDDLQDIERLEDISTVLLSKLRDRRTDSFCGLEEIDLERQLNTSRSPDLLVFDQSKVHTLISHSASCANEGIWSSEMLHRHLSMLSKLVSWNEASARLWINAILFRVGAMLKGTSDGDSGLVLSLDQHLEVAANGPTALSGNVDYTVFRGPKDLTGGFLRVPELKLKKNREGLILFVDKPKNFKVPLEDFVPQAVAKMGAGMKGMKKDVMRGALTNGRTWIFIIVQANESDLGGYTFYCTRRIELLVQEIIGKTELSKVWCDMVAGIIAQWVGNAHRKLDQDDCIMYG